jgi:uncharacterized protein (DUF305 family)
MYGNRSISRIAGTVMAALAVVAVAAGCGGGASRGSGPSSDQPSATGSPSSAAHNQADIAFAQGMIPHHEQAVRMADLAQSRASDPRVKDLAAKIEAAQAPEIEEMTTWLTDWGAPVPSAPAGEPDAHGGAHGSTTGAMPGMMTDQDMAALETASGDRFDRMFLEMMIRHHEGAVEMATTEQQQGQNPAAKALAEKIYADQTTEIGQMRGLLDGN